MIFILELILLVWRGQWRRFYDPNARIGLKLGFAYSTYGKGEFGITREDFDRMRCIRSEDRLSRKIKDTNWMGQGLPPDDAYEYIIATTPQSFHVRFHQKAGYKYRWDALEDPPVSGLGSRRVPRPTAE